jgi:hypothetical protein
MPSKARPAIRASRRHQSLDQLDLSRKLEVARREPIDDVEKKLDLRRRHCFFQR